MSKLFIVVSGIPGTVSSKGVKLANGLGRTLWQIIKSNKHLDPKVLWDGYGQDTADMESILDQSKVNDHVLYFTSQEVDEDDSPIGQANWGRLIHARRILHVVDVSCMDGFYASMGSPIDVQQHINKDGTYGENHGRVWRLQGKWVQSDLYPSAVRFSERRWSLEDLWHLKVPFGTCVYFNEEDATAIAPLKPDIFKPVVTTGTVAINGSRKIICRVLGELEDGRVRIQLGAKRAVVARARLSQYTDSTGKVVTTVATDPEVLPLWKKVRVKKDIFGEVGVKVSVKGMPLHVVREDTLAFWFSNQACGTWKQQIRQYLDHVGWPLTSVGQEYQDALEVIGPVGNIDSEGQVDKTPTGQWLDEPRQGTVFTGTGYYANTGAQEYAPRHQIDFSAFLSPYGGNAVVEDDEPRRTRRKTWVEEGTRVENPDELDNSEEWVPSIEAWQDTYDKLATPAHDASPDEWRRCAKKVLPATWEDLLWRAAYAHTPRVYPSPEGIWPIDIVNEAMFLWAEQVIKQFRQLRKEALELHSTSPYSDLYRLEKLVHRIRKPRAVKQQVLALVWDDVIAARDEALEAISERRRELKFEAASELDRKRARLMELPRLCMEAELEFRLAFFARFHKLVKLALSRDELKKFLGGKTQKYAKEYGLSEQNLKHCCGQANLLAHKRRESRKHFRDSLKQLNHNLGAWLAQDKPEHSMAK